MQSAFSIAVIVASTNLSSPLFSHREYSHQFLERMLPYSVPALQEIHKSKDVEASSRAAAILQKWYAAGEARRLSKTILPDNYPVMPWIDSLPEGSLNWGEQSACLAAAREDVGFGGSPDWKDCRVATEILVQGIIIRQCGRLDGIKKMLNQMRDYEIKWIQENGFKYDPPIRVPGTKESKKANEHGKK